MILRVIALTALSFYLAQSPYTALWLIGQIGLTVSFLKWFFLMQQFAAGNYFRSNTLNWFWGFVASIFCLVPFAQWKTMHPQKTALASDLKPFQKKMRNLAWKLWIPAYSLGYSIKNFWNIFRLFRLFKDRDTRLKFLLSLVMMQIFFFVLRPLIPYFWTNWIPGYVLFLMIVDVYVYNELDNPQPYDTKNLNWLLKVKNHTLYKY